MMTFIHSPAAKSPGCGFNEKGVREVPVRVGVAAGVLS